MKLVKLKSTFRAQGDQSNLASMSEKLVSGGNNILVGITTPATLALANNTKRNTNYHGWDYLSS